MLPTRMPSSTDAPIAAVQCVVRLICAVIWVNATPISESTYPSRKAPPLDTSVISRRNGVMATSSMVLFAV